MRKRCLVGSCGEWAEVGNYCRKHYQPAKRKSDGRVSAGKRGYGADWKRVRDEWIKEHPLCAWCGAVGAMVDHIESVASAPERRLDKTNLETLCWGCHRIKTAREKAAGLTRKSSDV